jgi:hypothetical protein
MEAMWIYSLYLLIYQKDKSFWKGAKLRELKDGKVVEIEQAEETRALTESQILNRMSDNSQIL